jgi:hypothetical protein
MIMRGASLRPAGTMLSYSRRATMSIKVKFRAVGRGLGFAAATRDAVALRLPTCRAARPMPALAASAAPTARLALRQHNRPPERLPAAQPLPRALATLLSARASRQHAWPRPASPLCEFRARSAPGSLVATDRPPSALPPVALNPAPRASGIPSAPRRPTLLALQVAPSCRPACGPG